MIHTFTVEKYPAEFGVHHNLSVYLNSFFTCPFHLSFAGTIHAMEKCLAEFEMHQDVYQSVNSSSPVFFAGRSP